MTVKISNISLKYAYLTLILFFNLNIFFVRPIDKIYYYPVILMILLYVFVSNFKAYIYDEKFKFRVYFSFFILLVFLFVRFDVTDFLAHFIYLFSFLCFINFLFYELKKEFVFNKKFIKILNYSILISLLVTNIHLFTHLSDSNRGWVWPLNIALQELILLNLIFAQLTIVGLKKTVINIILFMVMVIFRESGKAALFSFGLFITLYLFGYLNNFKSIVFNFLFNLIVLINFLVLILGVFFFRNISNQISGNNSLAYILSKRFTLISQSFIKLGNPQNFLWGSGFGTENYIVGDLIIKNTPQFLILTISVYGGVLFSLFFFYLLYRFKSALKKIVLNNKRIEFIISGYFFVLIFMLSFHEYFNNPLLIFSISFFIYSVRISGNNILNDKS